MTRRRSFLSHRTWWNRNIKATPAKRTPRKRAVFIESLEERRVLAWNVGIDNVAETANVALSTTDNVTTFTATGAGAHIHWADVLYQLSQGNHVVIDSGSTGSEAGNIIDHTGAQFVSYGHSGLSVTFQSGTGDGLVGNISIRALTIRDENASVVIKAHGSVTTGLLCKGTIADREQLGSVSITAANGSVSAGGFPGRIEAVSLSIQAATGIGTANSSIESKANNFEAQTALGGIFVNNVGDLTIGGVTSALSGVQVTEAGNIQLVNDGSIAVTVLGERVIGPGNIDLRATGGQSDLITGDHTIDLGATIGSTGGFVTLRAGRDLLLGDATTGRLGNVYGGGAVILDAGRDIIVDCGTFITASGDGHILADAGRNISVVQTAGEFVGAELRTHGGDITLRAGSGGAITLANQSPPALHTRLSGGNGDIHLSADNINLQSTVNAGSGIVTLRTSSTDGSVGIHIGGADGAGTLGISDVELDRITASKIVIGDETIANSVTLTGAVQHSGDADIEVLTARNIVAQTGSSWTTDEGHLTFRANRGASPTTGNFAGIEFNGAHITTVGTGNISLEGRGGSSGSDNYGVWLSGGAAVESTATGASAGLIKIDGIGGAGDNGNTGVVISNTTVTSVAGDIDLVGQGAGSGDNAYGIRIHNAAVVSSTGTEDHAAAITLEGVGGNGQSSNHGVVVTGMNTQLTSAIGDIHITGQGDGSGVSSYGVTIASQALVSSTGTGANAAAINIDGTGSTNGLTLNYGVFLSSSDPLITSEAGRIQIVGAAGGADDYGIFIFSGSLASADVTLVADRMNIAAPGAVLAGSNTVTLATKTTDGTVEIDLGGSDTSTKLGLTDSELDRITAGTIIIGSAAAGQLVLTADVNRTSATDIELYSGSAIVFGGGSLDAAGGDVLLAPGVEGVNPKTAGTDIAAGTVSFASDLAIAIEGQAVDAEHGQLNVAGTVDLDGARLIVSGGFVPPTGTSYTIVSADNILNQFSGLAEGAVVSVNGANLTIHYTPTSVVLLRPAVAQMPSLEVSDAFGIEGFKIPLDIQADSNDTDGDERLRVIISGVPAGTTFWRGSSPIGKDLGNGSWRFTKAWLSNLSILLPEGFTGELVLNVTARSVELTSGDVAESTNPLTIVVSRVSDLVALGAEAGGEPFVQVVDTTDGHVVSKFLAYGASFSGGVRVAMADMTGDDVPEIIAAQGPGARNVVRVFSLVGTELRSFRKVAYAPANYNGGVNVAAGDFDGDGRNDLVVAPSTGQAQVRIFRNELAGGADANDPANKAFGNAWRKFLAFPAQFTGGAVVAATDMGGFHGTQLIEPATPDGKAEVIVGSGPGMRATIRVFNVAPQKPMVVRTMHTFGNNYTGGIASLDAGRVNGDLVPEILVGAGEGFGARVRVLDGLLGNGLATFRAYQGKGPNAAVHAAFLDRDADGIADQVITAEGSGGTTGELRIFDSLSAELVDALIEDDLDFAGEYSLATA